jgi:arsenate reductase
VMAEAGVDISSHKSQHVDEFADVELDYIITLCDNARAKCPLFPGDVKYVHRAFNDPVMMIGTDDQVIAAFRRTRDEIKAFVEALPESLKGGV